MVQKRISLSWQASNIQVASDSAISLIEWEDHYLILASASSNTDKPSRSKSSSITRGGSNLITLAYVPAERINTPLLVQYLIAAVNASGFGSVSSRFY